MLTTIKTQTNKLLQTNMFFFNPSHPGALLRKNIEGLREVTGNKFTLEEIAEALGTTRKTLSTIINKKQGITAEMALRIAAVFRNSSAEYWLDLQQQYDLAQAKKVVSLENTKVLWDPSNKS